MDNPNILSAANRGGPKGHETARVVGHLYRCECGVECANLPAYRKHVEAAFIARAITLADIADEYRAAGGDA